MTDPAFNLVTIYVQYTENVINTQHNRGLVS